jgi:hypothetical protein
MKQGEECNCFFFPPSTYRVKFRGSNLIFSNDFFGGGVNKKEELFGKILLANVEIPRIL